MASHARDIIANAMRAEFKRSGKVYWEFVELWGHIEGTVGIGSGPAGKQKASNALTGGLRAEVFSGSAHPEKKGMKLWALIEIEDKATAPGNADGEAIAAQSAKPTRDNPAFSAFEETAEMPKKKTDDEMPDFPYDGNEGNTYQGTTAHTRKPRNGTPEHTIAKQAEMVERLEGLLEKALSALRDSATANARMIAEFGGMVTDFATQREKDSTDQAKYFRAVLEALGEDIRVIGADNRRVEAATRNVLEAFNQVEAIEDKAFKRAFKMAQELTGNAEPTGILSAARANQAKVEAEATAIPQQVSLDRILGRKL